MLCEIIFLADDCSAYAPLCTNLHAQLETNGIISYTCNHCETNQEVETIYSHEKIKKYIYKPCAEQELCSAHGSVVNKKHW